MFSDAYGLTQAVIDLIKTKTRRAISNKLWKKWDEIKNPNSTEDEMIQFFLDNAPYKVGEVVAVAQSYKDAGVHFLPEEDDEFGCHNFPAEQTSGWNNKMFTRAALMPHRIRITDVRVERLQGISESDCQAEGIVAWTKDKELYKYDLKDVEMFPWSEKPRTPREAYAALIDKIAGKGTFQSNPHVFAYAFELMK